MSSFAGPRKRMFRRHASAPYRSRKSSGPDDVPGALRHLRLPERHPAVREELRERLAEPEHAQVVQHLDPEAGVDHVHGRVVDPADVQVDRVPVVDAPRDRTAPRRWTGRSSAGSTRTSRRRCPSSRSRASPGRRTTGTARSPTPRPAPAEDALRLVVLDLGKDDRQLSSGTGRSRTCRSTRSGSGSPSSAAARSPSRAGGS